MVCTASTNSVCRWSLCTPNTLALDAAQHTMKLVPKRGPGSGLLVVVHRVVTPIAHITVARTAAVNIAVACTVLHVVVQTP